MSFIGANLAERIDLSANGNRLRFVRDIGNVAMDIAGVEQVDFEALGGADVVTVNDLSGTDLRGLQVDLDAFAGDGETRCARPVAGPRPTSMRGARPGAQPNRMMATRQQEAATRRPEVVRAGVRR